MDQETKQKTNELIQNAINFAQESGVFIAEQAPILVQEFLIYRLVEAALVILMLFICLAFTAILAIYFAKKNKKAKKDHEELNKNKKDDPYDPAIPYWDAPRLHQFTFVISSCIFTVMYLIFAVEATKKVSDIIKIKVAPRVYLIEELPKLFQ